MNSLACDYKSSMIWPTLTCLPSYWSNYYSVHSSWPSAMLTWSLLAGKYCHCPPQGTSFSEHFFYFLMPSSAFLLLNSNYHLKPLALNLPWFFPQEMILHPLLNCENLVSDYSTLETTPTYFLLRDFLQLSVSTSGLCFAKVTTCLVYLSIFKCM